MHPSHDALALSGYQLRAEDIQVREIVLAMTNQKPPRALKLWGGGVVMAWRTGDIGIARYGSPSGRLTLAYNMGFWEPGNGPRGRRLRLASSLWEGMVGFQWRLVSRCILGYSAASDAASSRWAMRTPRI